MKYQIFDDNGLLINTIVANQEFVEAQYPGRYVAVEEPPIPEPIPDVVTPFQAKAALLQAGLLPSVEAAIEAADPVVRLAWEYALEFRRTSPAVQGLAQAMGWTEEQLDGLFEMAATIEV